MFPKVPQSSLGILRVPQLPPPLEHPPLRILEYYGDADVILASIHNSRHVKQKLPSFGALEVYADGNLATCQCLDIRPP